MRKKGFLIATVLFMVGCFTSAGAEEVVVAPYKPDSPSASLSNTDLAPIDIEKLKSGQAALNVGHYNQLPPFYYADDNVQPGFGHDIFMEVAKKAGIQHINWIGFDYGADLNAQLEQGKIDLIANSWDLPGAREQFLLTTPYYTKGGLSFLYFKKNGPFLTADDLKDHAVGVFRYGYADRYWLPAHNVAKGSIKTYPTIRDLMFALRDGEVDVAVVYYPLAQLAQQQLVDKLEATLVQPINDVYAVRKQDAALQTLLNQAIHNLATEGTLNKIQAQYINSPPP